MHQSWEYVCNEILAFEMYIVAAVMEWDLILSEN